MKILHVTKKYPNALGGDAIVVSNLEKQQRSSGHEVIILTSNCSDIKSGSHIYKFGLKDQPAALDKITLKRLASLILLFFTAFRVLRNERPNIIHTHSVDMAFVISFAARHYKIPIVHTFHILTFYDQSQSVARRKTELLLVRGARPTIITAPNQYDTQKLHKVGLQQAVLMSNGVDLDFWKRSPNAKKNKVFTFITVGRLEEQKGIEYLIRATSILHSKIETQFKVIIIGEGSLATTLKSLTKSLQVDDYVEFIGRKSLAEIRQFYSSAHVAVFPSLYEAMPLSLLETWAMGLPVISTQVGILRDNSHEDDALIVRLKDKESLALAMHTLLKKTPARKKLERAAQKKVKNYAWTEIIKVTSAIYGEALR